MLIPPVGGGFLAGLLATVLSPDHLAAIITFSACQAPRSCMRSAIQWSFGNVGGIALIGASLKYLGARLEQESVESCMDYTAGFTLMCVGLHYLYSADMYLDAIGSPKQEILLVPSSQLDPPSAAEQEVLLPNCMKKWKESDDQTALESGVGQGEHEKHEDGRLCQLMRNDRCAAFVGLVQGLSCPGSLASVAFLRSHPIVEGAAFGVVFLVTITFVMCMLATGYGAITEWCARSAAARRMVYDGSCKLTIVLGLMWVTLNATDNLRSFLGRGSLGAFSAVTPLSGFAELRLSDYSHHVHHPNKVVEVLKIIYGHVFF